MGTCTGPIWVTPAANDGSIQRADLDGGNRVVIVAPGEAFTRKQTTPRRQLVLVGPEGDVVMRATWTAPASRPRSRADTARPIARTCSPMEKHSARRITAIMQVPTRRGGYESIRRRSNSGLSSLLTRYQSLTVLESFSMSRPCSVATRTALAVAAIHQVIQIPAPAPGATIGDEPPSSAWRCMAGTNWRGPVCFLINSSRHPGGLLQMPTSSWTTSPSSTRRDRGTCGRCERSPTSWPTAWWAPGCRIRRGGRRPLNGGNTTFDAHPAAGPARVQ